jgi:hypothetical protein
MDHGTIALMIPILGIVLLMIPVVGLTARFALKPIVESMVRLRESSGSAAASNDVLALQQRVAVLEQQLQGMESTVQHLAEVKQFDRQLSGGSEKS